MLQLNTYHAISGRFAAYTEERAICRSVARRTLSALEHKAFAVRNGRQFSGAHEDRLALPKSTSRRVDHAIRSSLTRHPRAWRRSPVVARPVDRPEQCNLILNQMLDYLGARTTTYTTFMSYCVLGTGTATPAVTDTALGVEVVRTNNTLSTAINDSNATRTRTFNRVFDFPVETTNRNYTELGLSHASTAGNNLGTRALISGGTVTVLVGQSPRVDYSVSVTLPANTIATPPVTGDTAAFGSSAGEAVYCTLECISQSVQTVNQLALNVASAKPTFGTSFTSGVSGGSRSGSFASYVVGSYKSVRNSVWDLSDGNRTDWRSLLISAGGSPGQSFAFVFDNAKTKDDTHMLAITWSITYGRA